MKFNIFTTPLMRDRRPRAILLPLFAAAMCVFAVPSQAQFGASLSGTVTDTGGGVIPNATAVLTNEGTHQSITRTTSGAGVFQFPSLAGGRYDLTVNATGFKPATFEAVDVAQDSPRDLEVSLSPGGSSETVTVNASESVTLQTADASISTIIDSQQLQKVPAYGRDPYNLVRTAPGITGDGARGGNGSAVFLPNSVGPGGSNYGVAATENTVQISAAGQRLTNNNFLVDGVSVNSLGYGGATVINPNIEAIGSLSVTSTSFSAEDGRNSGAQIKIVTKSGTNRIHGSAFFQYDEPGLNAYNKYGGVIGSNALPVRVSTKSRDYAASLGGPIIKDKLFAFASFEGISQAQLSFPFAFVETPQFRAAVHVRRPGSIADQIVNAPGGIPTVRNVLTQSCSTPVNFGADPCQVVSGGLDLGSPFGQRGTYGSFAVKNQIAAGGGLDGTPDIQYVQLNAPNKSVARQYNGRLDYFASPHDQFAGSAYVTKLYSTRASDNARPNQALPFDPTNIATTFIYVHTFAPTLLNELRANYTLFAENGVYDAKQAGINFGLPFIELQNQQFNSVNHVHFGANAGSTSPGIFAENQYEIRDTITKNFDSHTVRIGFEARLEQDNNNLVGGSRPTFAFAGMWNFFNDAPIYEGISANPATGGEAVASRHLDDHYYAGFVQHDWKATRGLTLNTGLRWEYFEPLYNKGSKINYPVLGTTPGRELVDAALTPHNHLWNSEFKNFSPKFGFAFAPERFREKTVLRGGFALAYNRLDNVLFDPSLEDGPGIFNYGICCGVFPGDFGSDANNSPYSANRIQYGLGSSTAYNSFAPNSALKTPIGPDGLPSNGVAVEAYGASPHLPTPYSYLYSLEAQNDLGHQFVVTVGYQGATGRHYSRLVNQLFTRPNAVGTTTTKINNGGLYIATNDSNLYYNGLNINVQKLYKRGLSLDATYTYSKAMDQVSSGDGANGSANQTDPARNYDELGPSDYDVRHRVVGLVTYDVNYYHGDSRALKLALNGWQLNGIFTAHTGFPFTPVTFLIHGIPTSETAQVIGPVRPTYFQGHYSPTCSNDAFRNGTTVSGQFGVTPDPKNLGSLPGIGRNSFRGPCYQDIDLGIAKEFHLPFLGEQGLFRFQAQAFNLINRLNFSPFTFNTNATRLDGSVDASGNVIRTTAASGAVTPFGRPISASAGRVIEFNARFSF